MTPLPRGMLLSCHPHPCSTTGLEIPTCYPRKLLRPKSLTRTRTHRTHAHAHTHTRTWPAGQLREMYKTGPLVRVPQGGADKMKAVAEPVPDGWLLCPTPRICRRQAGEAGTSRSAQTLDVDSDLSRHCASSSRNSRLGWARRG